MDARAAADLVLRPLLDIGRTEGGGSASVARWCVLAARCPVAVAYVLGAKGPDRYRQGLVAAFVSAGVLLFAPGILDSDFSSGAFLFRDPMSLFGIVLGSLALETPRGAGRTWPPAPACAGADLFVCACRSPAAWESSGAERGRWRDAHHRKSARVVDRIPGRWYLAPQLDALVREGRLQEAGLWRDIWIYRGLPIVNGSFKGVSADVLYPSGTLPIGRIVGEPATAQSAATLAGLGIAAVLATSGEPVAPDWMSGAVQRRQRDCSLLRNPRPGRARRS